MEEDDPLAGEKTLPTSLGMPISPHEMAPGPAEISDEDTALPEPGLVISIRGERRQFRKLHRWQLEGSCNKVPGLHYKRFEVVPGNRWKDIEYDSYCANCWRSGITPEMTEIEDGRNATVKCEKIAKRRKIAFPNSSSSSSSAGAIPLPLDSAEVISSSSSSSSSSGSPSSDSPSDEDSEDEALEDTTKSKDDLPKNVLLLQHVTKAVNAHPSH
jgi:hypothetical protein